MRERLTARRRFGVALVAGAALLTLSVGASLLVGARPIAALTVLEALRAPDLSRPEHIVVFEQRLPRTVIGLIAGAGFGVAGVLMQAATRNPLAEPGLTGVNAGAAFGVIVAIAVFGIQGLAAQLPFAIAGAILVSLLVYGVGAAGPDGATSARLLLAGVAASTLLASVGQALVLLDPVAFDGMRAWALGALAGRDLGIAATVAPPILLGLGLAVAVAEPLDGHALGDDLARAIGGRLVAVRAVTILAVTLLAGAATAAVGPIGFIGLMVPHALRPLLGAGQRRLVLTTMLFAPALLLTADCLGRLVVRDGELEAGLVTAFIGAPVLIGLFRRSRGAAL